MNRNEPIAELRNPGPDDLDRLLTRFYQSEVPSPWPPAPHPEAERPTPASRLPEYRSQPVLTGPRVSLAVSVALLLGGCWFLSSRTADAPVPHPISSGLNNGTAEHKTPIPMDPKDQAKLPCLADDER